MSLKIQYVNVYYKFGPKCYLSGTVINTEYKKQQYYCGTYRFAFPFPLLSYRNRSISNNKNEKRKTAIIANRKQAYST